MNINLSKVLGMLLILTASASAAGNNWMTSLNGSLPISQFSIPGTHDTGARYESFPGTAKCQDLTIPEQLNAGIRFLDIRCRHIDDAFTIHHGSVYQNLNFADVLNSTISFLTANPGETVIMSVKEEYTSSNTTRSFEATFDAYVAQNPGVWLLGSNIPTLSAARGKIVLFRRFGASSLPKGIDASNFPDDTTFSTGGTLRVQDHYNVSSNTDKWNQIKAILNEARYGGPNTLYVNFSSGVNTSFLGIPSITTVSNSINPQLTTFFNDNPSGRFGAILMDFANADRASMIYNTNAPSGRAVAHPAYFMIVNRNSGKAIDLISGNTSNGAQVNQWTYDYNGPNQRWALAPTENGDHFRISSWVSGKCACIESDSTSAGALLHAYDYTGNNPGQQFDLVDAGNGYYKIRNVNSGLVLEVVGAGTANNDRIQQSADVGSNNQQWRLQPWGDYFVRASTGKYVCIENSGNSDGDRIVQYSWENNPWFKWRLEGTTNGYMKASSLNALTRVISMANASTVNGEDCQLYSYSTSNLTNQQLRIAPKTNGTFKFYFVHDGKAWDIPGGQTGNLVPLEQYTDNANAWQDFQLERLVP
ncbi:phosphatidylinositol-specific phospholipase C domain-containing protein [Luteolibacter pohnpeiensis]|uniref:1-phosphatidylinositol phosphodiesterase n=1 Tax=Luteolibacter pohnpeiensis TaxID=454153 RepID=A0A934VPU4_9BACT|nr:phosphatidylinositol-specific phospholipase C domain-containing protein [Luteolibacter pohnpeiensis]MBK1881406.1 phosphatidylinositol-specific phospholipase C domain-containing protein [Luteolibacter pohnpeiensis]